MNFKRFSVFDAFHLWGISYVTCNVIDMDNILIFDHNNDISIFSFISLTLKKVMNTLNLPHWFTPGMISEIFGNNYFVDIIKVLKFSAKVSASRQNARESL